MANKYLESIDKLNRELRLLKAMIAMTIGTPGESFRELPEIEQDAFLWAVSEKIENAMESSDAIHNAHRAAFGLSVE